MAYKNWLFIVLAILTLRGEDNDCMPDFFDDLNEPATVSVLSPPFDLGLFLEESPELQEQFEELSETDREEFLLLLELLNMAFVAELQKQVENDPAC